MKKKAPSKAVKKQMPMPELNVQPQTNNVNFQVQQIQQVPPPTMQQKPMPMNVRGGMCGYREPPRTNEQ